MPGGIKGPREIEQTFKPRSIEKLSWVNDGEKVWLVWAKDQPGNYPTEVAHRGINFVILDEDIRQLLWERIRMEKEMKRELLHVLCQRRLCP